MPHSRNHRYRSHTVAAKLQKNLGPPTSTLHVANLPEGHNHADIKVILPGHSVRMFSVRGLNIRYF